MSSHVLARWEPENPGFWQQTGARIANRNLWISIPALMLAFSIWMLWSVVVVNLDRAGFMLSKNQMFWLTALPALSGATLRIFYSFLVPVFGGRKWTAISTASLLLPALGMGFALRDPTTSFPTLLVLALPVGWFVSTSWSGYALLIGAVLLLMLVEVLNTGIEAACNAVSRDFNVDIQLAKDCGSLAVLIAIMLAAGIWILAIAGRLAGGAV